MNNHLHHKQKKFRGVTIKFPNRHQGNIRTMIKTFDERMLASPALKGHNQITF
jgi:hypothetical protein